jgi:mannobiose 2-epimerase
MARAVGERDTEAAKAMGSLREKVERELRGDILPFWLKHAVDEAYGGFRGQIANDLRIDPLAHKGLILNARILWTFAKAYKYYGDQEYLTVAKRAYQYLMRKFWDEKYGGLYWMVDHLGKPIDTKKRNLRARLCRIRAGGICIRRRRQ